MVATESGSVAMDCELTVCALCGADNSDPVLTARDVHDDEVTRYTIVRCRSCGFHYLNPRPTLETMERYYSAPTYARLYKARSWRQGRLHRAWRRYTRMLGDRGWRIERSPGRMLDVGCGFGDLMLEWRARGWRVEGIDTSAVAVRVARERGLSAFQCTLDSAELADSSYDVVVMRHVLEHVHDPRATLSRIRDLLVPGGILVVQVPNFGSREARLFGESWQPLELPRHLSHFDAETLTRLLTSCSYRVDRVHVDAHPGSFTRSLARVLRVPDRIIANPVAWSILYPLKSALTLAGEGSSLVVTCTRT